MTPRLGWTWVCVGLVAACGAPEDGQSDPEPPAAPEAPPEAPQEPGREAQITDTLHVEGNAEPVELRLTTTPEGFPVAFSAYAPVDLPSEVVSGEVAALRWVAEFGGVRNPDAFLEVMAHPADASRSTASARAEEALRMGSGGTIEPVPPEAHRYGWSLAEWRTVPGARLQGGAPALVGHVALGLREGRHFHIAIRYPPEYGDGFGPRAGFVLETWRWADGSPLGAP